MKNKKPIQLRVQSIRRSALSLLFVALFGFGNIITVDASVGVGGSFAGTNYRVQPGSDLIETGTDFNFVNNFDTAIMVDFNFEAPLGVEIVLPSDPVQLAARSTYRIPIQITTTQSTPIGTFPLRIVGRVVNTTADGVEVSGSAGLNASITVQGIAPTTAPVITLISRTQTSFTIRITNNDLETVTTVYSLTIAPPETASIDIESGEFVEVTFTNLEPNTIYTVEATATATPRDQSNVVSFQATTLSVPVEDDEQEDSTPPAPTPPAQPAPTPPPSTGGVGPININVLVIELDRSVINVEVFDAFDQPEMIAYVSIRDNVKETSRIDLTSRVVITGVVNPNVVGRYELRYFLRYNTFTLEELVVVNVLDTTAPQITSAAAVTIKIGDPFLYKLQATDNYTKQSDLIVTGFPEDVDTSVSGVQRFNVIVTDQSGNRTPFLFTVNVRERAITPIAVLINEIDVLFEAIEGLFDETSYRIEFAVAANLPLRNSPSWTLFSGQTLTQDANELVYVRVTDASGNALFAAVDIRQGRVIPLDPDSTIISGDAWWQVLLRSSNLLLWIIPLLVALGAWAGFFYVINKRRRTFTVVFIERGKVISEQRVAYGQAATPPNKGPWNQSFETITSDVTIERTRLATRAKPLSSSTPVERQPLVKTALIEPLIVEEVVEIPIPVPKQVVKKPRKRRKTKDERYVQLVALEENGAMDDDLLGAERLNVQPKLVKEVKEGLFEETIDQTAQVDERQIDLFDDDDGLNTPTKPKKK